MGRVKRIITIDVLKECAGATANRPIMLHAQILQGLNKSSLDVSRLSCFDGRIDKAFTPAHSMEEELPRAQPRKVRVFDKTTRTSRVIKLGEVGECAVHKSEWNSSSLNILLPYTSGDLTYVYVASLRAGQNHHLHVVVGFKRVLCACS